MFIEGLAIIAILVVIAIIFWTLVEGFDSGLLMGFLVAICGCFVILSGVSGNLRRQVYNLERDYVTLLYYQDKLPEDSTEETNSLSYILNTADSEHLAKAAQEYELRLCRVSPQESLEYVQKV